MVILNYNVRYFLELCLLSVSSALKNIDSEIIVVDNHSKDDSCAMVTSRFPQVKLIRNNYNTGFPKGNNIGVSVTKGKYICILNPDTVVGEDTFEKTLEFAKQKINLGIVGVKLIDGSGAFLPESKRGIPSPWVAFTKVSGLYKIFPQAPLFNQYYCQQLSKDQSGEAEILVGAFMFLERSVFDEVAGFDEDCFMYSDDIDLSYRVLQKGKKNWYFHQTAVLHFKGESTLKDADYFKRFKVAMEYFLGKHFKVSLLFGLFMKLGILFFSVLKWIQSGNSSKTVAEKYILLSNEEHLLEIIRSKLQKKLDFLKWKTEKEVNLSAISNGSKTQLLLDNEYVSFKECISILEKNNRKGLSFRIIPRGCEFMVGSDSSKDRGEIVIFK